MIYQVWSLDVWGHLPGECLEHACEHCCKRDEESSPIEHDDNRCMCDVSVNDRRSVGKVEIADDATDVQIIEAMIGPYFADDVLDKVQIDDPSGDREDIYIETKEGYPLFQLEKIEAE